jgi:hypothetical protein
MPVSLADPDGICWQESRKIDSYGILVLEKLIWCWCGDADFA